MIYHLMIMMNDVMDLYDVIMVCHVIDGVYDIVSSGQHQISSW